MLFGLPSVLSGALNNDKTCKKLLGIIPSSADDICITKSATPEILVYGDSHASALYKSVFDQTININAMIFSRNGCFSLPNLPESDSKEESNDCKKFFEQVLEISRTLPSINTIIIGHRFPDTDSKKSGLANGQELTKLEAEVLRLELLTKQFTDQGKKIVVVIDIPILNQHPRNCLQKLPFKDAEEANCQISRNEYIIFRQNYLDQLEMLATKNPNIKLFDPINIYCDDNQCKLTSEGKSLYYDIDRISSHGSLLIWKKMIETHAINF